MGEPVATEVKEAALPEHGVVEAAERVIIFGVRVVLGGHGEYVMVVLRTVVRQVSRPKFDIFT